ncbi:MAG: hypothetical protein V2A73_01300 [Pseudomonadota bacterium]
MSKRRNGKTFASTVTEMGYPMDELASWLRKAVRRGDTDAAAWAAWQFLKHGYVRYLWRSIRTIASEDVGAADPLVHVIIDSLANNAEKGTDGFKSETFVSLAEMTALVVLCRAPKNWVALHLAHRQELRWERIKRGLEQPPPVPAYALDMHTKRGKALGKDKSDWWQESASHEPKASEHDTLGSDPFGDVHAVELDGEED